MKRHIVTLAGLAVLVLCIGLAWLAWGQGFAPANEWMAANGGWTPPDTAGGPQ